ncbi:MAG: glycosyltransferase [Alkaliphilus sp.]|nr:WecB/TagA/CpsF family glycosyltransferase [bacterium AH-315-G05]PHS35952.1 MAG: glycosyltransferase [Alkaliphilus sp.]
MKKKSKILNVAIDAVTNKEALEIAIGYIESSSTKKIYTPNPEIVMMAQTNDSIMRLLNEGDLVVPDGIGIIVASKIKKLELKERVAGVDLVDNILKFCAKEKKSFFILGGKPGIAELACEKIKELHVGSVVAGYFHGYFKETEDEKILRKINDAEPDVVFVCLGAPKQEIWIDKYHKEIHCKLIMGVGGSVDIYAGTVKRAPQIFINLGLEWFYRLIKEPWRFKRMLVLPRFLIKVLFS